MNQTILFSVLVTCMVVFYTYLFLQSRIMRHFNLVDSRELIGSQEVYMKLNTLIEKGDVSLYSHSFMDEIRVSLSLSYGTGTETVTNRFSTKTLDEAVNQAYDWSVQRGFIKE